MKTFLSIIGNKILNYFLVVLVATIPFFMFLIGEVACGWGGEPSHSLSPLRVEECFMALAITMLVTTPIIEFGRFFHSKVSGIISFISFVPATFMGLYIVLQPEYVGNFFQMMCAFGVVFYPYVYLIVRRYMNANFLPILAPVVTFTVCLLIGIIFGIFGNMGAYFVVYRLPFFVGLGVIVIVLALAIWIGFDILSTRFFEAVTKFLPEDLYVTETSAWELKLSRAIAGQYIDGGVYAEAHTRAKTIIVTATIDPKSSDGIYAINDYLKVRQEIKEKFDDVAKDCPFAVKLICKKGI